MTRIFAALALLLLVPAAAQARAGDPDRAFGRRGTVTLKATSADAVGGAVKVISGNRVLARGAAAGQFVVVRVGATRTPGSPFGGGPVGGRAAAVGRRPGRPLRDRPPGRPGVARHDARRRAGDLGVPRRPD